MYQPRVCKPRRNHPFSCRSLLREVYPPQVTKVPTHAMASAALASAAHAAVRPRVASRCDRSLSPSPRAPPPARAPTTETRTRRARVDVSHEDLAAHLLACSVRFPSRQTRSRPIPRLGPRARGAHRVHLHVPAQRHPRGRPVRPPRGAPGRARPSRPDRRPRRPRRASRRVPGQDHRRGVHALVRVILLLGAGDTAPAGR